MPFTRPLILIICLLSLSACTNPPEILTVTSMIETSASDRCPLTEPAWLKPSEDAAIQDDPAFGYYFVNEDQSIWASAWQTPTEKFPLRAGDPGNKMGWFRPAGAPLEITGQRLDADSLPLEAEIPCCYPTRFQATGLYFPTAGCWEVTARAEDHELTFIVQVEP